MNLDSLKRNFEVNLNLSPNSYVDVLYSDKGINDRSYILFSLLVYARMLRLLPGSYKEIEIDACKIFSEFNAGVQNNPSKKEKFFQTFDSLIEPLAQTISPVPPLNVVCYENTIQVGTIYTKDLDKYIYLIFLFAWNNINPINRPILFGSFVAQSNWRLKNELSATDAILIPNRIAELIVL